MSFPLAAKAEVRGEAAHPFYRWAALERPGDTPRWNFHKYLVGRDGRIVAVFPHQIAPTDARVIAAIEKELRGPSPARTSRDKPPAPASDDRSPSSCCVPNRPSDGIQT